MARPKKTSLKKTSKRENRIEEITPIHRLYRSQHDRILGGVAGGLGEYFGIDPILFRLLFIVFTVFGGGGILLYLLLWIIIPSEGKKTQLNEQSIRDNVDEMRGQVRSWAHSIGTAPQDSARSWLGILLLLLGIYFLMRNLGIFMDLPLGQLWPIALVLIGISIFMK